MVFLCMVALLVTLGAAPVRGETTRVDWVFSKDPNITSVEEELPVDWQDTTDEGMLGEAVELPILMYHHLTEDSTDSNFSKDIMWVGQFRRHMELLQENGYQTVSLDDLIAFGESGTPLPDNPVMITFDDGYESVYTLAYPILQELDMQAVVFPVGVSVGEDTIKGRIFPSLPILLGNKERRWLHRVRYQFKATRMICTNGVLLRLPEVWSACALMRCVAQRNPCFLTPTLCGMICSVSVRRLKSPARRWWPLPILEAAGMNSARGC